MMELNMNSKATAGYVALLLVMFLAGFWVRGIEFDKKSRELSSGTYEWAQDLIVVGMDREIVIDDQSGVFIAMESYLDPIHFEVVGDHFQISTDTSLYFYLTESGFNIIEEGGITHSVWNLKE